MRPNRLSALFVNVTVAALTAATLILTTNSGANAAGFECAQNQIAIQTDTGPVVFQVELADTPALREKGLMFRKELPEYNGMLFVYDEPREAAFWMRNTYIPLDMIFMDESGVIRHIHANARPHDETPIPGAAPGDSNPERKFILEISGSEATRLGVEIGQAMASSAVDQAHAAWPCE